MLRSLLYGLVKTIFGRSAIDRYHTLKLKFFLFRIEITHRNDWIFFVAVPIGDTLVFCDLLQEFKRRFGHRTVLLLRDQSRATLARQFAGVDFVYVFPRVDMYEEVLQKGLWTSGLKRGKIMGPPVMTNDHSEIRVHAGDCFLDQYKDYLHIIDYKGKVGVATPPNAPTCSNNEVYIVPDANTLALSVEKSFWLAVANRLVQLNMVPVFNAPIGSYGNYRCAFLSLADIPQKAASYRAIIGVRCGLLDLFAWGSPKCLVAIYPREITHPTYGRLQLEDVRKRCPNAWQNDRSDDDNFRSYYSLHRIFDTTANIHEIVVDNGLESDIDKIIRCITSN